MSKGSTKKDAEMTAHFDELTLDLQRTRADFENYRKRAELEKELARETGKRTMVLKLLPLIDNIDRAIAHLPKELEGNAWAEAVVALQKQLQKSLKDMGVDVVAAEKGTVFNHDLHEAIMMEDGEGDRQVIAEVLQPGYSMNGVVLRHAMVKVTTK